MQSNGESPLKNDDVFEKSTMILQSEVRVFARGLRSEYMSSALLLLSSGFSRCAIWAKLDRWRDSIAPFMARDAAAGLYPARDEQDADWADALAHFRNVTMPHYRDYTAYPTAT